MDADKVQEALKKQFLEVRDMYRRKKSKYTNMLVIGDYGSGKTQLYTTCPRPVHIDSFDPGGTKTRALQPLIDSGDILVDDRYEEDSWKDPKAFALWERVIQERKRSGYFDAIGTYGLDSCTFWGKSLMFELLKRGGLQGKQMLSSGVGSIPQQRDYLLQQLNAGSIYSLIMGLPCHVLVTGHIASVKNEITGGFETGLMLWGKLADQTPLVFDEKYIMRVRATASGAIHQLQVKSDGIFKAETRIGGDKFNTFEEPNIRALLKKAGRDYEDKPKVI